MVKRSWYQSTEAPIRRIWPGDGAARAFLPSPDAFHEGVPAEILAGQSFRVDLALDHHLGRDACVVGSRLPQRAAAVHAVVADERVHDRVLERVAHVQRPGHVGGRDHDAVGLAGVARNEVSPALPAFVPLLLDPMGVVGLVHGGVVHGLGVGLHVLSMGPQLESAVAVLAIAFAAGVASRAAGGNDFRDARGATGLGGH